MSQGRSQRRTDGKFVFIKKIRPKASFRNSNNSIISTANNNVFTEDVLKVIGDYILMGIREEIDKVARFGSGVPRNNQFKDSFFYEIKNDSKGILRLYLHSDWLWVGRYLKERGDIEMKWLTGLKNSRGKRQTIPIKDKKTGKMVFRNVPLKTKNAWVHPAINKYNFIENGIKKGQMRSIPVIAKMIERKTRI
jgi:hypothetical protein